MRIVYFGTGAFAVPALERLADHVVLAVTQPDRPSGRHMRPQPSPVRVTAERLGIPVETPERSRAPEFVVRLGDRQADFLLVASYGQILSEAVLSTGRHGGINLHGSILPKYRGAAPIQRAILAGEAETGVTLMQMDRGMDSGDVIDVVRTPIGADETYGELHDRLSAIAADLAGAWSTRIASGNYARTPQDPELATLAPKIDRAETELDLRGGAVSEYNRFRAFTPSPGAFLRTRQGRIKLKSLRLVEASGAAGQVLELSPNMVVAAATGALAFVEVQPDGRRQMEGRSWANGARMRIGDNLLPDA